jgi:hypothetical protein
MNPEKLVELIGAWGCLRFFPADVQGRAAVAKLVAAMCSNLEQVRWLKDRLLFLFDEWPGPRTLRMVYCQRWKPADGIDIRASFCEQYPDGFPPLKAEAPSLKLPPGTVDVELQAAMNQALLESPSMSEPKPVDWKRAQEFDQLLEETLTSPDDRPKPKLVPRRPQSDVVRLNDDPVHEPRPAGTYKPITQADVEAAVKQLHAQNSGGEDESRSA